MSELERQQLEEALAFNEEELKKWRIMLYDAEKNYNHKKQKHDYFFREVQRLRTQLGITENKQ